MKNNIIKNLILSLLIFGVLSLKLHAQNINDYGKNNNPLLTHAEAVFLPNVRDKK